MNRPSSVSRGKAPIRSGDAPSAEKSWQKRGKLTSASPRNTASTCPVYRPGKTVGRGPPATSRASGRIDLVISAIHSVLAVRLTIEEIPTTVSYTHLRAHETVL